MALISLIALVLPGMIIGAMAGSLSRQASAAVGGGVLGAMVGGLIWIAVQASRLG